MPAPRAAATEEDLEELQKVQAVAEEAGASSASASSASEEELVEYEGMLVSAAAAQRRR